MRRDRVVVFMIVLILALGRLTAREFFLEEWGCYLDLPQGWEPVAVTDDKATFTDTAQRGYLQVKVYSPDTWESAGAIFEGIGNQLKADGEGDTFLYQGMDSAFASYLFAVQDVPYKGFAFLVNGEERDWVILSFAELEVYEPYEYFLLSALDSFSISFTGLLSPGPVSRYYESSYSAPEFFNADFDFEESSFIVEMEENGMESAEILVERETAVLSRYTPEDEDAWSRFYRMIYRDNYRRTDGLFRQMILSGVTASTPPAELAERILVWLQDFSYSRSGTASDFLPPLSALYNLTGDCDSLGLLYVILLKHYGIDAVLMVSSEYAHALAGVDVPGAGAHFTFEGKEYLIAELTDKVALGMIAASMADPAKWMGISFN